MSKKNNPIKFKKRSQRNHIGYYITLCNQTNFFNESIYSSYPCYFDYEDVYKIGVCDTFHLDDNALMYSLIVDYFAIDKTVHIIAPNLKDMDSTVEPLESYWTHDLKFDYRTGEPKENISQFEFVGYYELVKVNSKAIACFSHGFVSPITNFTFIIGADGKALIEILQNQKSKPLADEILAISDYIVTLKIIEDDEGYNNHVLIQAKSRIYSKIERLEYLMESFRERYDELIVSIGDGDDIDRNTELYLSGVKKLKEEIFDIGYVKRE